MTFSADPIYQGIKILPKMQSGTHLIMDIGGGSTEFILIKDGEKVWANSYPLGLGMLYEKFHKTEPISQSDQVNFKVFVHDQIPDMIQTLNGISLTSLTGAAGSFEILQLLSSTAISEQDISIIDLETFYKIYQNIIQSTPEQRANLEGLPAERAKLVVVGMFLKKVILDLFEPSKIFVSPYALKEGVMREMMVKSL